jgi:hypothetical protein
MVCQFDVAVTVVKYTILALSRDELTFCCERHASADAAYSFSVAAAEAITAVELAECTAVDLA